MTTTPDITTMTNPIHLLTSPSTLTLTDRGPPSPLSTPHSVRLHILATGICGSDLHYHTRGRIGPFVVTAPLVLGHESSGRVTAVGSAVTHLRVGDLVAIEPGVPCGRCGDCRSGAYNLCADTVFAATPPWDGTLAKWYETDGGFCYKVPEGVVDGEEAAMVEPVAVAVQVCRTAGSGIAGGTVVVFGCGPIGVLCQAVARAWGARRVVGVDVAKGRVEFARGFGEGKGEAVVSPEVEGEGVERAERVAEVLRESLGLGEGPDVVLECTGAEECIQAGVFLARKGGTFVQAGMGKENVVFPITTACVRALTIKGSIRYTAGVYPAALDLVASGKVKVKQLITHRFKFEDAAKAFKLLEEGKGGVMKVVIAGVDQPLLS